MIGLPLSLRRLAPLFPLVIVLGLAACPGLPQVQAQAADPPPAKGADDKAPGKKKKQPPEDAEKQATKDAQDEKAKSKDSQKKTDKAKPKQQKKAGEKDGQQKPEQDADDKADKPAESGEAENDEGEEGDEKPAGPETVTLKKEPLRVDVTVKGVLQSQETAEIVLRPDTWGSFTVLETVEHGARVKRGDLLIACETEKIDEAIADLRTEIQLMQLSMKEAQDNVEFLEKGVAMDRESYERTQRYTQEDLKRFLEEELPFQKKAAEFMLKTAKDYVAYQREELKQLEKMYEADDLTEETEEIILRRARDALERAEFSLKQAKQDRDELFAITFPRAETRMKKSAERERLSLAKAKAMLPLQLKQQKIETEKLEIRLKRSREKLDELLADRKLMNIRAPVAGVVYYGESERGQWSSISSAAERLKQGASLSPNKVLMTIVQTRPLAIRATVAEKHLHEVRPGVKGYATPAGYPRLKLEAIVAEVGNVPVTSSSYDAKITVALDDEAKPLMPGMNCNVKLRTYENRDALTVPPSAVKTDPDDPQQHFVMLLPENKKKKSVKRAVEIGRRTEKRVEIVKGLAGGDRVLKQYPNDDK